MKNLHDWIIGLATKLDALVGARVQNVYHVECRDGDGNLKWEEDIGNTVTTEGLADLLTKYFKGSSYNAAWYMGLKGTGSIVAGDTLALHAGWTEVTAYTSGGSGNRPAPSWASATGGSLPAAAIVFTMTGAYTVAGVFLCTVTSGSSGTLYGGGDFATARSGAAPDTLTVTPTATAASA